MEPEQRQAEAYRILYRLGIIDRDTLNKIIDQLQIRLFSRELRE
jgi:hypothetical protein